MESSPKDDRSQSSAGDRETRRPPNVWMVFLLMSAIVILIWAYMQPRASTIPEWFFNKQLKEGNIANLQFGEDYAIGHFKTPPKVSPEFLSGKWDEPAVEDQADERLRPLREKFKVALLRNDRTQQDLIAELKAAGVPYKTEPPSGTLSTLLLIAICIPIVMLLFMWMSYRRTRDQFMGGGFLGGFNKSPAKRFEALGHVITFSDVAGLEGVKADLQEIVEYLKSPEKFQRLGGRVPKGVLLNGPPGTGKTLLARAVAGEAGVPFYSVNGSEFIQMFVGVGASRVRDLFTTAKESSPAIIFIDEIDAVGRQRGAGLGGGHDEREQTLNQILSEMDGFSPSESVIVMAATNRPDVLDPALLRPGRFDRHVTVDRPTKKGRLEIFKVHVRDVPLDADVDLERLATGTVGMTGADIRNVVNEAALWAARHDKTRVQMEDFETAKDKVLMGGKREEVLQDDEKEKTAYHEAGHTLTAWKLAGADPVHKVTIVPRGRALGVTQIMPTEDRLSMSKGEMLDHLIFILGGQAAEKLVYNETTAGAENDLERATSIARRMVTYWGMSERLGPVSYKMGDEDPFLGREIHQQRQFSEHTMEVIDAEVAKLLHRAADDALQLLSENREALDTLTHALVEREELTENEITELIGASAQANAKANRAEGNGKPEVSSEAKAGNAEADSAEAQPNASSD